MSPDHYIALLEGLHQAALCLDADGRVIYSNGRIQKFLGFEAASLLSRPVMELFPSSQQESIKNLLAKARRGEAVDDIELPLVTKSGREIAAIVSMTPLANGRRDVQGVAFFIRDISERRQAEERMRAMNEELRKRSQELEQFAYIISHDLREPLRTLHSYCGFLKEDLKGDLSDNARQDLHFITSASQRMDRLIQDLLEYSRVGRKELRLEEFDLSVIASEVLEIFSDLITKKNAKVKCCKLPVLMGDPLLIRQLLQNLVSNALKYNASEQPTVELTAEFAGDHWVIGVRDNGIGISADFFERIFIPFQRLHPKDVYEGAGMGLAICKKIVERHGGKIWVNSVPKQGSHFKFHLNC